MLSLPEPPPPGHGKTCRRDRGGLRPHGTVSHPVRKDLRGIKTVIGTGGPLIFGPEPETVPKETLYSDANPFSLKPKEPTLYLDEKYILYAIGLLAELYPDKALRIAKKYLRKVEYAGVQDVSFMQTEYRMNAGVMRISSRSAKMR